MKKIVPLQSLYREEENANLPTRTTLYSTKTKVVLHQKSKKSVNLLQLLRKQKTPPSLIFAFKGK